MNTIYTSIGNVYFSFEESGNYYQTKGLKEDCQLNENDTSFTKPSKINNFKSYIPIAGCLVEHIIYSSDLYPLEKLNYLLADALSLISHNNGKKRTIALAGNQWAKKLNCSKSTVFSSQKSLVEKGYFNIIKDKNEKGQNERNIIIPTIPDNIFEILKHSDNRTKDLIAEYDHKVESKIGFLSRTKLFIKLNYYLLKTITCETSLNPLQKIIWLDFYIKCYKRYHNTKGQGEDCFFTASYQELSNMYSCNKSTLSKSLNALEKAGFIKREHFFIKHTQNINARRDNSLWKFTISLPETLNPEVMNIQDFFNISFIDPDNAKSGVQLNKNPLSVKDIDNIDTNCQNSSEKSKNLSEFYNNNIIRERRELEPTIVYRGQEAVNETSKIITQKKEPLIAKSLKDYYPLSKTQVDILQVKSGRGFSTNFTNELLLKMSRKYPNRQFASENQMLVYMGTALKYEKHQETNVNHETFRFIKGNEEARKENEKEREIEKYLTKEENNILTDKHSQLRRKILGQFGRELAYELLRKGKFTFVDEAEELNEEISEINNSLFKIRLPKSIKLTERQRETLHEQIVSVYGEVDIKYDQARAGQYTIPELEEGINLEDLSPNSAWYKIRKGLIDNYGLEIDKSWFSKLDIEENTSTNILTLKAPTNFYRDYISGNYGGVIQEYSKSLGLYVQFVSIVSR